MVSVRKKKASPANNTKMGKVEVFKACFSEMEKLVDFKSFNLDPLTSLNNDLMIVVIIF